MRLVDRVAIVTGAARGVGRSIAQALGREGAVVAVVDVNGPGAAETAQMVVAAGGEAGAFPLDITDVPAIGRVVGEVSGRWGDVHILVNCASWDSPMPFVDTTPEFWDKVLAVNLKGPMACTRAVLPQMIERDYGKIVFIASDAGRVGSAGAAVYSAARGGLIAFAKSIAREVARCHINVNCVCPGPSEASLLHQEESTSVSPKLAESLKRVIPWGRLGTAEDVAPAVAFLASDDAGFITGQTLSVSGGLTMI